MTNDSPQRVFIAARPDLQIIKTLEDELTTLALCQPERLRWVPPSNWHLTLRFMGNVDHRVTTAAQRRLADVAARHHPFQVKFNTLELYPSDTHPRVLAATTDRSNVNQTLIADLETLCQQLGLPAEPRPWRPHISLARVRGRKPLFFVAKEIAIDMEVTTICLLESVEKEGKRMYLPLTSHALTSARL